MMRREGILFVILVVITLSIGCIKTPSYQEKNGFHEEHPPKKPYHPSNEITVEFINSSYAVASGETSGTFHTGQEADIMLSGIDFNRT